MLTVYFWLTIISLAWLLFESMAEMDDDDRNLVLDEHNRYRSSVARRHGGAKNMYKLSYSKELEISASEWAKECTIEPSDKYRNGTVGESIFKFYFHSIDEFSNKLILAVAMWNFYVSSMRHRYDAKLDLSVKRFIQIILANTLELISAIFSGNTVNGLIYEPGEVCKQNNDCTTYPNSVCESSSGLCVLLDKLNMNLSIKERDLILEEHNRCRSQLALGLAQHKGGGRMPPGVNIYELVENLGLMYKAASWARKCQDEPLSNQVSIGKNIFVSSQYLSKSAAILEATKEFWQELRNNKVPRKAIYTNQLAKRRNVNRFTQMAWGKTKEVGCAIQYCKENPIMKTKFRTVVACFYMPSGNVIDEPIYEVNETCATRVPCRDATYDCIPDHGLCQPN